MALHRHVREILERQRAVVEPLAQAQRVDGGELQAETADDIDLFVEVSTPLVELPAGPSSARLDAVAANAAREIEDGSAIQIGVGRLPTAVLSTGLMLLAFLSIASGLILDTVTRGRREMKLLAYLAQGGPADQGIPR